MKLKTITAKSMSEALAEVRRQLGEDAVVLHTRSVKSGGLLGLGAKTRVEITAGDGREIARYRAAKRGQRGSSTARQTPLHTQTLGQTRSQTRGNERGNVFGNGTSSASHRDATAGSPLRRGAASHHADGGAADPSPSPATALRQHPAAGDLIRRTYQAAQAELDNRAAVAVATRPRSGAVDATASPAEHATPREPAVPSETAPPAVTQPLPEDSFRKLCDELREVKRLVGRAMRTGEAPSTAAANVEAGDDALVDHYLSLIKQEVAEELAGKVLREARGLLPPSADGEDSDGPEASAAYRRAMIDAIAKRIPIDEGADELPASEDGRPRVIALVGPTGVGKTTTVAKLAAMYKLKRNKRVGLITMDTYRIAAVDQLKTYAGIIGVPLHVASTSEEVRRAMDACGDCDVVLIDTAGRSPSDAKRLEQTRLLLDAAQPHETHLVLSATCSQAAMMRVVERFDRIASQRIIVTKLDEAETFGVLLNVPQLAGKRLSFVTTGQEVPHQIEVGRSERLAALVLGETLLGEGSAED
ncbi:MAG: flagellar biosynthesis protein FlhF [Phycisphaeraceae bacterium]